MEVKNYHVLKKQGKAPLAGVSSNIMYVLASLSEFVWETINQSIDSNLTSEWPRFFFNQGQCVHQSVSSLHDTETTKPQRFFLIIKSDNHTVECSTSTFCQNRPIRPPPKLTEGFHSNQQYKNTQIHHSSSVIIYIYIYIYIIT
jgi:hypothetical protein